MERMEVVFEIIERGAKPTMNEDVLLVVLGLILAVFGIALTIFFGIASMALTVALAFI